MSGPALPLFGRKYRLTIKSSPDSSGNSNLIEVTNSDWEPEALRVTFDIYTTMWRSSYWYADITIYNLDQLTAEQIVGDPSFNPNIVTQGMKVILEAGYYNGNFGTIWEGFVVQPMWDRENVVDFKLTLHCAIGLLENTRNFVAGNFVAVGQQDLLLKMLKSSYFPVNADPRRISSSIPNTPSARPVTVFGNPGRYMDWIVDDNAALSWLDQNGFAAVDPGNQADVSNADVVVYTPTTGIIGTPVQTQFGCDFTLLLDPRIQCKKPAMQVKIDNTIIQQEKKFAGIYPSILDQDGFYIVYQVNHTGDTRGESWYTRVTGLTSLNGIAAMIASQGGLGEPNFNQ